MRRVLWFRLGEGGNEVSTDKGLCHCDEPAGVDEVGNDYPACEWEGHRSELDREPDGVERCPDCGSCAIVSGYRVAGQTCASSDLVTTTDIALLAGCHDGAGCACEAIAAFVAVRMTKAVEAAVREEREACLDAVISEPTAPLPTLRQRIYERIRALTETPEEPPVRGRMVVEFAAQPDGHGGWDVTEPVSALCVCECETEADAERVAAMLRAVAARVKP